VIFGVGTGWSREEMRNHGTEPRTRVRLLNERLAAIKEIWTKDKPARACGAYRHERAGRGYAT
jgi:alkanesulfonate monooxygenase SsuD/methylene tetrahydromethanopterin reductase-like flavin-dependent oxidoreductase (luciferase family)